DRYDVAIVGGALAGAATALLVLRFAPGASVLLVERQERFGRKVGEATVEVSGYFLHEILGFRPHLEAAHLPKHGLRFWFADGPGRSLAEMTEVGSWHVPRLPSFQLDRARFDEAALAAAREAGCEVARPAKVTAVELGWPESRLSIEGAGGGGREVAARWVIDASGRQVFLARRLGLLEAVDEHPTAALWGRWRGVADMDGPAVLGPDPERPRLPPLVPRRRNATNHFCGYGWWCWVIPLAGGDTSVGLVYDKRLFELPGEGGGGLAERYRAFLASRPGLAELLAGAEPVDGDFLAYRHLPYRTSRYAGRGWALVGDAAGFMDPYYSPGLDHLAMSAWATARLVADDLGRRLPDAALDDRLDLHARRFRRSYERWLAALYLGKYELLGDAELVACAYLVETALYYLGIVTPIYRDPESLANPTFGLENLASKLSYAFMARFNRRLNRLARHRRATGRYGAKNVGHRFLGPAPGLGKDAWPMLREGLELWLRLEAAHLGARLRHGRRDLSRPVAAPAAPAGEGAAG
ncbi:MAG TPA: tryptophan 7-halogenase, partial [Thermoanaerobaculia bacterium]|nr:tryptophan 7-halogenase [Thermoanaerobaculia bacterium]